MTVVHRCILNENKITFTCRPVTAAVSVHENHMHATSVIQSHLPSLCLWSFVEYQRTETGSCSRIHSYPVLLYSSLAPPSLSLWDSPEAPWRLRPLRWSPGPLHTRVAPSGFPLHPWGFSWAASQRRHSESGPARRRFHDGTMHSYTSDLRQIMVYVLVTCSTTPCTCNQRQAFTV